MGKIISLFTKNDKYVSYSLFLTLGSAIFAVGLLLIQINNLPGKIPLFYSLPWGDQQLISTTQIFLLPILMIGVLLINTFISSQLHNSQIILKRMLVLTTVVIDVILLITIFKIITIFI